ncbi:MAG: transcription elongation factor, partial [Myxococcales bacterium]
ARRAGVPLKPPAKGKAATRKSAKRAYDVGQGKRKARPPSRAARPGALRPQPKRKGSRRAVAGPATSPRRGRGRGASGRGR